MTAELLTKDAVEFGEQVTLYRVIDTATGKGTLWHRDADLAWTHFQRLFRQTGTSSRTPVLWATWQADTGHYAISDGDATHSVSPAHVISLRSKGAVITCYGGPLDHRGGA